MTVMGRDVPDPKSLQRFKVLSQSAPDKKHAKDINHTDPRLFVRTLFFFYYVVFYYFFHVHIHVMFWTGATVLVDFSQPRWNPFVARELPRGKFCSFPQKITKSLGRSRQHLGAPCTSQGSRVVTFTSGWLPNVTNEACKCSCKNFETKIPKLKRRKTRKTRKDREAMRPARPSPLWAIRNSGV